MLAGVRCGDATWCRSWLSTYGVAVMMLIWLVIYGDVVEARAM